MRRFYLLSISFYIAICANGQDHHFSQFYATPVNLNPALTGNIPSGYRISAIHRNQWAGIGSAFETTAFGAEMNLKLKPFETAKTAGAGVSFINDHLGEGVVSRLSIGLSGAFHLIPDVSKRHAISFGVQGRFGQTSIDYSSLTFESQYQNFVYTPDLGSGESFTAERIIRADINAGIAWGYKYNARTTVRTGFSAGNINFYKETFYEAGKPASDMKFVWHGGVDYELNEKVRLMPKMIYMHQENNLDLIAGGEAAYSPLAGRDLAIIGGVWGRLYDAAIFSGGVRAHSLTLRASYDATLSKLNEVKSADNLGLRTRTGAFEVSLVVAGALGGQKLAEYTIPCEIF